MSLTSVLAVAKGHGPIPEALKGPAHEAPRNISRNAGGPFTSGRVSQGKPWYVFSALLNRPGRPVVLRTRSYRTLRDGSFEGRFPGTSCQATIGVVPTGRAGRHFAKTSS